MHIEFDGESYHNCSLALGLVEDLNQHWDMFLSKLIRAQVRLKDGHNKLICAKNKASFFYTTKLGYCAI